MKTLITFLTFLLFTTSVYAANTQTNVSGSNTSIEGGYTGGATTYESGSSSSTTTNSTSNSNIRSAPPTSSAPSYNSMTQDVCAVGASAGVQTFGVGVSGGKHFIDKNCERLKLARILDQFGMKVASISLLCQDERVFYAMEQAGTPCPFEGKIGKEAAKLWKKHNYERPDHKAYIAKLKKREDELKREKKLLEKELKKAELEKKKNNKNKKKKNMKR